MTRPVEKGSYILIIRLLEDRDIGVGRLGMIHFRAGWYAYVGSAMNGLQQRISYHLRQHTAPHWHIDYLLAEASVYHIITTKSPEKLECFLARHMKMLFEDIPGFGSSDCGCSSHLFYSATKTATKDLSVLK